MTNFCKMRSLTCRGRVQLATSQDAVPGTSLMVTPCRDSTKGECTRCFYIRRGSFKKLKVAELRKALLKSKSLKDKFLSVNVLS